MAFLGNDAINRINLHYGIQALAQGAGAIFFLAFLLHAGVPIAAALVAQAAIFAGRFALRPVVLPMAKRWGLKPMVVLGTLVMACQYPLLARVHGIGPDLLVLCVVAAIGDVLYWPTYHAYFAALGDPEHRGHQVSAREGLAAVINIIAPLVGGWALVTAGPATTFIAVGLVQALSALPLLGAPNVAVAPRAPGSFLASLAGMFLGMTDGWFGACYYFVWQIGLFVSLRESLSAYGGAMALAALAGAISGLLLGRYIDAGHGRRAVIIAYLISAAVVVTRAVSIGSPWLAVAANAAGGLVICLATPALMTATYNLAKASPCPLRFHMATEAGWDAGGLAGCLVAAALATHGQSLSIAVLLALPGLAAGAALLWRHYPRTGVERQIA